MHLTHMIIDDFLPDPHTLRKQALSMHFPDRPEGAYYPGRNAGSRLPLQGIERLISDLTHEPLAPAQHYSHAVPRIALGGDDGKVSVHADFCHWSMILYLTLDDHCQDGTHFFRHKKTGWERAPVFPGEAEHAGFSSPDDAMKSVLAQSGDRTGWEEIMMIPMKFNRAVLFRGYMWHDAGKSFGTTPENGRLIVPLFFENTQTG